MTSERGTGTETSGGTTDRGYFHRYIGLAFEAPQPLTHAVNYAMYPLQVPLIYVFVRLGEWIMGAPNVSLAPYEILQLARTDMVRFVEEFGLTCLHAMLAWSISAPLMFV